MLEASGESLLCRLKVVEAENRLLRAAVAAAETSLAALGSETTIAADELLANVAELRTSRSETKDAVASFLGNVVALAASRAETLAGASKVRDSITALASARAESKGIAADLLTTEVALAASQEDANVGATDLMARDATIAAMRTEMEIGVSDLLASVNALSISRAETKNGVSELLVTVAALAESRSETKIGMAELRVIEAANGELQILARELRQARDGAIAATEAKSRFLAGMSHELRTPLNAIMGYAHLLHIEGGLSVVQETRVQSMLGASRHLLEMIAGVLDLSAIEAGHLTLRLMHTDPEAMAAACLELVRAAADAKELALIFATRPDTPLRIVVDSTRLRQVLLNLLGNAVKYTPRGSVELRMLVVDQGASLRIEVADTGPGIPADLRPRLFQDFERLDIEDSLTAEGAGLGLSLSSRLVTLMGGRIGHSNNPGGGSNFWLELPLEIEPTSVAGVESSLAQADASPPKLMGRLHVLVVDDVPMNCDIAVAILRAKGHEATCVESGVQAVEAATRTDFDVILMDVRMPQMDGLEATRRIRALDGVRGQVPIVALTAQSFTDQVTKCRDAGMDDHLVKPFDPDSLLAVVVQAAKAYRPPRAARSLAPRSP